MPGEHAGEVLLRLADVTVVYGEAVAVESVSLDVRRGTISALLGANGAGKTSLLRAIMGLATVPDGEIEYAPLGSIRGLSTRRLVAGGLALVPEGRGILPSLSVRDNLLAGTIARRPTRTDLLRTLGDRLAEFPRLAERQEQLAGTLSGGEQQMLALARALMATPEMLLLDEPSLGLAPLATADFYAMVSSLVDKGLTVLVVEQRVEHALAICNEVTVLRRGRVVASGPPSDFQRREQLMAAYIGEDRLP